MNKRTFSNNLKTEIFDNLYSIPTDELNTNQNIDKYLFNDEKCLKCNENQPISIKKFKKIEEQLNLNEVDNNFGRCECGKRHIDIVMTHVLKIMKEENVDLKRFNLRNGAIPLITPMTSETKGEYIEKNSLIILHPKLTKKIAKRILNEISEVKGILKGDSKKTVGMIDSKSEEITYKLIGGNDFRCDIIQSPIGNIAINKIQHLSYLEFPKSMENKIMKLCNYLKTKHYTQEEIANLRILDGTCGNGTLGIFLLKLGVKKVIFNDIWKPSTVITSINLKSNGFKIIEDNSNDKSKIISGKEFEVFNFSIEELAENILKNNLDINMDNLKFDICILDCFPNANIEDFENIARLISKDIFII
ncbi:hypothetical protein ALNOE001_09420 [Candidatus Methanobinarius endosymbioticus]|uniref:Uncharacterized protein n=1 Tax=Candidatus Methanobinarius endosymbioticus TaxID=2006182 RepID=A0A366MAZ5_9EURY|nr:hypothetical protein ALNOE001_09420 [Candidatus Methanobinarius endosymbioticus]